MALLEAVTRYLGASGLPALMLWGPPGTGKSSMVRAAAEALGMPLVDLRLSQMNPVDLRGVPVPDSKSGRTAWFPPSELPSEERDGPEGILCLEELPNAPRDVQVAALQLVLDRRLGDYVLPPGWRVAATGNRVVDRAGSYQMVSSLANRFVHLPVGCGMPALELSGEDVSVSVDAWKAWAYRAGIREEVVAYLNLSPQNLWRATKQVAYATPRTWEFVSRILDVFGFGPESRPFIAGAVGEGPGGEFLAFCRCRSELPDVDALLSGEPVPPPGSVDVSYLLCASVVSKLCQRKKKKRDCSKSIAAVMKYLPNLSDEFQVLLMRDLYNNAGLGTEVSMAPGWKEWYAAHREIFEYAKGDSVK